MAYTEALHGPLFRPEPAYDLWAAGRLAEVLRVPDDGTRVEIIGGEIVVSPGPRIGHCTMLYEVLRAFATRDSWRMIQSTDINLAEISDGYVPDLIAVDAATFAPHAAQDAKSVLPSQIALAVEITSPSNAADDRKPGPKHTRLTVPYYLLIDRDPKVQQTTLFSEPDRVKGRYRASTEWAFGETIALPEPFAIEIPTPTWRPWNA